MIRIAIPRIDARTASRQVVRAAMLWLGTRLAVGIVAGIADAESTASSASVSYSIQAGALVVCAVIVLVLADIRAIRERVFLANLGIGQHTLLAIAAVTAIALEIGFTLTFRALG